MRCRNLTFFGHMLVNIDMLGVAMCAVLPAYRTALENQRARGLFVEHSTVPCVFAYPSSLYGPHSRGGCRSPGSCQISLISVPAAAMTIFSTLVLIYGSCALAASVACSSSG